MTADAALVRLAAMGYQPDEANFLIMEEQRSLQAAIDKQMAAEVKAEEAAEKAAQKATAAAQRAAQLAAQKAANAALKLAKQAQQAAAAAVKAMKARTPPALLAELLKTGQLSQDQYTARMLVMGEPQSFIDLEIARVCNESKAACIQSNGQEDSTVQAVTDAGQ